MIACYENIRNVICKTKGMAVASIANYAGENTGHLDEVYDKIKNDNGWFGGSQNLSAASRV